MCWPEIFSSCLATVAACITLGLSTTKSAAAEPWVKVEEDWVLRLNEPDSETNSPQLTVYLTPNSNEPLSYFQVQLNHAADRDFLGGGFRVAAISNDVSVDQALSSTRAAFTKDGDEIRWTSVMVVTDTEILFAIKNGTSQAWGDFGGPDYLVRMNADQTNDFSQYAPQFSINNLDIGLGRNRVQSLKLQRVRAFREDGTYESFELDLDAF